MAALTAAQQPNASPQGSPALQSQSGTLLLPVEVLVKEPYIRGPLEPASRS